MISGLLPVHVWLRKDPVQSSLILAMMKEYRFLFEGRVLFEILRDKKSLRCLVLQLFLIPVLGEIP